MSFICAVIMPEGVVFGSDTRRTIRFEYGQVKFDDTEQKIFQIPGTNGIATLTGGSRFGPQGNHTFSDILTASCPGKIHEIPHNIVRSIRELGFNSPPLISLFFPDFTNGFNLFSYKINGENNFEITCSNYCEDRVIYMQGAPWATSLGSNLVLKASSIAEAAEYAVDIVSRMIDFCGYMASKNQTIGGDIDIWILTEMGLEHKTYKYRRIHP